VFADPLPRCQTTAAAAATTPKPIPPSNFGAVTDLRLVEHSLRARSLQRCSSAQLTCSSILLIPLLLHSSTSTILRIFFDSLHLSQSFHTTSSRSIKLCLHSSALFHSGYIDNGSQAGFLLLARQHQTPGLLNNGHSKDSSLQAVTKPTISPKVLERHPTYVLMNA
jgi:hypothetical protein